MSDIGFAVNQTFFIFSIRIQTLRQLYQLHSIAITTGRLATTLPKLLYTFALLLASPISSPPPSLSPSLIAYASSLLRSIEEPSTFCYNTAVRALTLLSSPANALHLFAEMLRRGAAAPDFHSFPFALKACGLLRDASSACCLHGLALRLGFLPDIFVVNSLIHAYSVSGCTDEAFRIFNECYFKDVVSYNTMIDGLVKSGDVSSARRLFDELRERDSVTWGTLIAGYAQWDMCREAMYLFSQMMESPQIRRPDNIALVSALSACAQLGEMDMGRSIHGYIVKNHIPIDSFICTGLVDLYTKCGSLQTAIQMFEANPRKNLHTWNAMIVGLAIHGEGPKSLGYFSRMIECGVKPDGVTLLGVLVGCSHSGLVNKACQIFDEMETVHGVTREPKHYGCLMDLLGRAGLVNEAMDLIRKVPENGDIYIWGGILGGCRKFGDIKVAEEAAKKMMDLFPEDGGVYSIMAGVYAGADRWEDVVRTRASMSAGPARRKAGCSMIEVEGIMYEFVSSDTLHPQSGDIYSALDAIDKHQTESQ
ncbi:hypothetical protein SAY86_025799 [Trapa natans]|uniref:Pentatricopeptide repeat-containing protein n=1 Tax=Trapa natans TaxID=22666 RepID=A0AAN7KCP2_TRANT|nr:hypothetical protein SAY86_025799 [Trapa natans]